MFIQCSCSCLLSKLSFSDRGTLPGYPCVARYGRSILFDWLFYLKQAGDVKTSSLCSSNPLLQTDIFLWKQHRVPVLWQNTCSYRICQLHIFFFGPISTWSLLECGGKPISLSKRCKFWIGFLAGSSIMSHSQYGSRTLDSFRTSCFAH